MCIIYLTDSATKTRKGATTIRKWLTQIVIEAIQRHYEEWKPGSKLPARSWLDTWQDIHNTIWIAVYRVCRVKLSDHDIWPPQLAECETVEEMVDVLARAIARSRPLLRFWDWVKSLCPNVCPAWSKQAHPQLRSRPRRLRARPRPERGWPDQVLRQVALQPGGDDRGGHELLNGASASTTQEAVASRDLLSDDALQLPRPRPFFDLFCAVRKEVNP